MQHSSVRLNTPIEFINIQPLNPLISKCQIKVCYVGEEPNRNGSVITKEVAKDMANSLPGCPIVGFYNDTKEDFEEHNRIIDISNGKFEIKDTTQPYGFIPLNAKVWFEKFLDDGNLEHEYLVTEGYLWTGQYPECKRVLIHGNNQSMELDEESLRGNWSENDNGGPELFIINEAIISKLCILGNDNEPCFEGANITSVQFSFDDNFQQKLFSMMNELKELLQKGGVKQVFERYSVEVGDELWKALYDLANGDSIIEVCVDGDQTFAVFQNSDEKFYRVNFSYSEAGFESEEPVELTDYALPEDAQFDSEEINKFISEYEKVEDESDEIDPSNSEDKSEEEDEELDEEEEKEEDDDEKKAEYSLEEIPEYVELASKYNALVEEHEKLQEEVSSLKEFKLAAERKEKEEMIAQFYMLNDEDKKDVIENIDVYSLDQIEAKLSILCVRNKVKFDEEEEEKDFNDMTFNLNDNDNDNDVTTPAWVKAVLEVEKKMK